MKKANRPKSKLRNKQTEIILLSIAALVVIGFGWLVYSGIRAQRGNPIILTQDDVPRISAEEAYQAVMKGEAVLLDTRTSAQYADQRAVGTLHIPLGELEARLPELDPELWYITYCT